MSFYRVDVWASWISMKASLETSTLTKNWELGHAQSIHGGTF